MNRPQLSRILATLLLVTFSTSIGCSTWRPAPSIEMGPDDAAALVGERVRFHTDDGVITMWVERVEFPYAYGHGDQIRVDLSRVHKIETYHLDTWKVVLFTGLTIAVIAFVVWAISRSEPDLGISVPVPSPL